MCYVIVSRQLLANVLRTRTKVTIKELKSLATRIQRQMPEVAVDISHYSLSDALENYANMFEREDEVTIAQTPSSQGCFEEGFVDVFFNQEMPGDIRARFLECIESQHAGSTST